MGQPVAFTASATDEDEPAQRLTFSLDAGAPTGASLDAETGAFAWLPTDAGSYSLSVRVTDDGSPALSDTEQIVVNVTEAPNSAPILSAIGDRTVDEQTALTFKALATDTDTAQTLTFSLGPGAPDGARIGAATGEFAWTPTEAQGPGTFSVTVIVSDNGSTVLSDSETFSVTVNEVNLPPSLAPIADRTVTGGQSVSFTASATDPDRPVQPLAFSLEAGAPTGATIDRTTGAFNWTPTSAGTFPIAMRVSDSASPARSDTKSFSVTVRKAPVLSGPVTSTGDFSLTWTYAWGSGLASNADGYQLEESTASATSGFVRILNTASQTSADRQSPKTFGAIRPPGTCWYRVRAYELGTFSGWSDVWQVRVTVEPRRITLINTVSPSLNLDQIVQVKVSTSGNFGRADLLTADQALGCMDLPGASIDPQESRAFDISIGSDYQVFIGIGVWDPCDSGPGWFKRRFFTDPDFNVWYVWTIVKVTGHSGGDWRWRIGGS